MVLPSKARIVNTSSRGAWLCGWAEEEGSCREVMPVRILPPGILRWTPSSRRPRTTRSYSRMTGSGCSKRPLEPDEEEPTHHHRWPSVFVFDSVEGPIHDYAPDGTMLPPNRDVIKAVEGWDGQGVPDRSYGAAAGWTGPERVRQDPPRHSRRNEEAGVGCLAWEPEPHAYLGLRRATGEDWMIDVLVRA